MMKGKHLSRHYLPLLWPFEEGLGSRKSHCKMLTVTQVHTVGLN